MLKSKSTYAKEKNILLKFTQVLSQNKRPCGHLHRLCLYVERYPRICVYHLETSGKYICIENSVELKKNLCNLYTKNSSCPIRVLLLDVDILIHIEMFVPFSFSKEASLQHQVSLIPV